MVANFLALLVSTLPTHSISKWFETYDRMPAHFLSLCFTLPSHAYFESSETYDEYSQKSGGMIDAPTETLQFVLLFDVLGVAFECWGTFLGPSLVTWMSI